MPIFCCQALRGQFREEAVSLGSALLQCPQIVVQLTSWTLVQLDKRAAQTISVLAITEVINSVRLESLENYFFCFWVVNKDW